jgi:hypothetical protein
VRPKRWLTTSAAAAVLAAFLGGGATLTAARIARTGNTQQAQIEAASAHDLAVQAREAEDAEEIEDVVCGDVARRVYRFTLENRTVVVELLKADPQAEQLRSAEERAACPTSIRSFVDLALRQAKP